ncbi:hypothetical protein [Candidatus Phyllobacterium onerii]|uniref:hypothetical protein n=1 Tax=Candidatus Phyllobacterium onerii TaxID=3020828 RepID=UPI00232BC49A|nr:hypothetical protein [Phyllobacterium sp. IY22]
MLKLATVVLLAFISSPGAAQEPQGQIAGIGAMSCQDAIKLIDTTAFKTQLFIWAAGFLSGANSGMLEGNLPTRTLRSVTVDTAAADTYAYCARHADEHIVDAIKQIYIDLPRAP